VGEISFWYRPTRVVPDQRPLNGRCRCRCWYQLPELIPTNSNSGLHSCISISIHTQHVPQVTKLMHYNFALAPISTLVRTALVTGFRQPLQMVEELKTEKLCMLRWLLLFVSSVNNYCISLSATQCSKYRKLRTAYILVV